jgi:cilia- and flagella-associated protein 65
MVVVARLNALDVLCSFGLDCVEKLVWKGWKPGGEYLRTVTVRNVSVSAVRLKYKLPSTKYFSMGFPEPINLVPGMSHAIQITFRPVKMAPYDDEVHIITNRGSFPVKICAETPAVRLEVPIQLDFGFCAVHEVVPKL